MWNRLATSFSEVRRTIAASGVFPECLLVDRRLKGRPRRRVHARVPTAGLTARLVSMPGIRAHGAAAPDALGEHRLLVEPAVGRERDRAILGLAGQVRVVANLVLERGRDP